MANENPTCGAPRIHGELLKLGFEVSERTVSRYLGRLHRRDGAAQHWRTFLRNHREAITGMDFFTAITVNFRILYCLFLIRLDRREIIHWNVTEHPTGEWVVQQLRESFPENTDKQYLIFDRDGNTHEGLGKDTPRGRPPSIKNSGERLASHPRLEVSTIAIPGQKLLKRCERHCGDLQRGRRITLRR